MQGYTDLQVCQSAAGYYIGRMHHDDTVAKGFIEPGSRESGYYPTYEVAQEALKSGTFYHERTENVFAYEDGSMPDIRNSEVMKQEIAKSGVSDADLSKGEE